MTIYIRLNSRCNRTKKNIELLGNAIWVSTVFTFIVKNCFLKFRFLVFKEIIDLIPFHVFSVLLMLFLKLHFSRVDKLLLYVLYSWCKNFLLLSTHLMYLMRSLFLFSIAFWISFVSHDFCWNVLYVEFI